MIFNLVRGPSGPATGRERVAAAGELVSGLDSDDGGQQLLLGKMLLERGLITPDQLREALVERARKVSEGDKSATPLGGILVRRGFLTDSQLVGLVAEQGKGETTMRREAQVQVSGPQLPALPGQDSVQEGTQLGKYLLTRELGRGGMGVVFEATDTQLQRKVALKLMLSNPNADPKERAVEEERFIQEAQLSARLKHPNIVTVYEAGLLDGRQFLAMELIEGTGFNDWRKTVPVKEQIRVIRDVSAAVHHAHEQGILHRDLKPRNILMGGTRPYVTDFGLAKSLSKSVNHSLTGSGAVVGTPAYMSPEQAQGLERVDWRTDIYSLGVILYETMTGRTPFIGESPIEILMKVVKDPVPPPLSLVSSAQAIGLDKAIESICLKAIAKKDRDRYVTAQAFADDLSKWLAGEQVKVTLPKAPKSPLRRIYALMAILVLALGGTLGWLGWMTTRKPSVVEDLVKANGFLADGNFEEAKVYYRVVLAKDPGNFEAINGEKTAAERIEARAKAHRVDLENALKQRLEEAEKKRREVENKRQLEQEASTDEERQKAVKDREKAERDAQKLEEDVRKAAQELERTRKFMPPSSKDPGDAAWTGAVNLFPFIDPQRNAVWGSWEKKESLVSDRRPASRLELPYQPPQGEYDLRVLFERRSGAGGVSLILSKNGHPFRCEIGGAANTRSCIEVLSDFKDLKRPALVESPMVLENDRRYLLTAQVRKGGVQVLLDRQLLLDWKTDYEKVGIAPEWRLRNAQRLGLGSDESEFAFHMIELREVEGTGRPVTTATLPVLRALPSLPGALKPGLIGEYFFGTDFAVRAMNRIESMIDFTWGESPAWAGGPADQFSCRYSGYLHVPRTAQYRFSLTADDGARLVIDDVQLIGAWMSRTDAARVAEVSLEEGYHRILIEHFDAAFRAGLSVAWSAGGGNPMLPLGQKSILHGGADFLPYVAPVPREAKGLLPGHSKDVSVVQFGAGGGLLMSGSEDRRIRFWDAASRKELGAPCLHPTGILSGTFIGDSKLFVSSTRDQRVRVWDLENRVEVRTLEGFGAFVQCLAVSPDGKWLAAGSFDRTIRIWATGSWDLKQVLKGHTGGVETLGFTPDSRKLVSGGLDHTIRVWDFESSAEPRLIPGHADAVAALVVSRDGKFIYSAGADGLLKAFDLAEGRELRLIGRTVEELACLALSSDGRFLATGGSDGLVRVWDLIEPREPRILQGHTARVGALAFQPGKRLLASGSFDSTIRLWNLE